MNFAEVSIIDEQRIPCYVGTSIETRADKTSKLEYRCEDFKAKIIANTRQPKVDYSQYERVIAEISK